MEECSNNMERLLAISLSHNGATPVTLASNTYDALGRLATSSVNNGGISTAYAYNVRGWEQSVTNAHFYEWIHYQDAPSGGIPCWGGGISGITWLQRESLKAATSVENQYKFSYDGLNRLTKADFSSSGEQWNGDLLAMNDRNFSCTYAYDLNSNMTALQRYGVDMYNTSLPTHIRNHGMIDNLTMTYDGNRLKKVTDQCEELSYAGAMDFKDGADKDEEYTYDANGNMTCDRNKGIHSITYNMLNLLETVLFNDGHETRYTYAADGRKLHTEYRLNNFAIIDEEAESANFSLPSAGGIIDEPIELEPAYTTLMTRDYCGNYIYSNGALERILTGNGYIQGGEYYFYIKDYQGNIRVVLNQNNQPIELNSYYPYGALMAATTTEGTQPYKYGTKELDRENGLDLYDSKARMYDPTIGRTPTQDPMAEKYYSLSPYLWCAGNPITFTDPNGEDLIINGSCILKQIYLEMLHNSTGNIYAFDDKNKLMLKGKDFDFNGESSQTLSALVSSAINSERVYSFSLTGEKGDDKSVFIDSYETKQLDISDLKKIGKTSIALQGALIGHQINEIMVGGDYLTAHNESLKKEGVIYGELVGDCSISSRIQFPNMPDRPFDNIFEYNANHSFLLKSGGCIITKKIGDIGTITTVNSNGELKKVKKL